MLASRASSAFVCLRCELSSARSKLPVLDRRLARRSPHASFSTSDHRRDAFDDHLIAERPATEQKGTQAPTLTEHPLGRRFRRKKGGRAVIERTAQLQGAKTLGEDAAILVLTEVAQPKKETPKIPEPFYDESTEAFNLAEVIENDKPATLDEVVGLIDNLRPKSLGDATDDVHYISQAAYVRLARHLARGFNGAQLMHYYVTKKNADKKRAKQLKHEISKQATALQKTGTFKTEWSRKTSSVERCEWSPGTTDINKRLPNINVQKSSRRAVTKHVLVDQILREQWQLVMLEEIESAGELEMTLEHWQLVLLTLGDETALDRIGRARRAKLEVHRQDKVLRITADKHTAEYAADDVKQLLNGSKLHTFDLKPWTRYWVNSSLIDTPQALFAKSDLQTVRTMTGAYLKLVENSIVIRGLTQDSIAEAQRCLIKMMPIKEDNKSTMDTSAIDALEPSNCFQPVAFEPEALPFSKRKAKFARWSLPTKQSGATSLAPWIESGREQAAQKLVFDMVAKPDDIEVLSQKRSTKKAIWAHDPEFRLRASFGQALFASSRPTSGSSLEMSYFLPTLPGLSSIFHDESFELGYVTVPNLVYHFMATNDIQDSSVGQNRQQYPTLAISFKPNATGKHVLRKVVLQYGSASHHILLPERVVDIHFETNRGLHLLNADRASGIQDFAAQVIANIESGGRLNAPNLELMIPKWTVAGMEYENQKDETKARFLFTGVKVGQSLWGQYKDRTITYVTAQHGKLSRVGSQFSMVYGLDRWSQTMDVKDREEAIKAFVHDAFGMADSISEAATVNRSAINRYDSKRREALGSPSLGEDESAGERPDSEKASTSTL